MVSTWRTEILVECWLNVIHDKTLQGDDRCKFGTYSCLRRLVAVSQIFNFPSTPQLAQYWPSGEKAEEPVLAILTPLTLLKYWTQPTVTDINIHMRFFWEAATLFYNFYTRESLFIRFKISSIPILYKPQVETSACTIIKKISQLLISQQTVQLCLAQIWN